MQERIPEENFEEMAPSQQMKMYSSNGNDKTPQQRFLTTDKVAGSGARDNSANFNYEESLKGVNRSRRRIEANNTTQETDKFQISRQLQDEINKTKESLTKEA